MKEKVSLKDHAGKIAFTAYCLSVGGKDVRGGDIPTWENLSESVRAGWVAAALAVVASVDEVLADKWENDLREP